MNRYISVNFFTSSLHIQIFNVHVKCKLHSYHSNPFLATFKSKAKESKKKGEKDQGQRMLLLPKLGIGFGNLAATAENTPPGGDETILNDSAEMFVKAATHCCGSCLNHCCCMCCIQVCTKMNNQCATVFSQLCIGLGCYSCLNCCSEICCTGDE